MPSERSTPGRSTLPICVTTIVNGGAGVWGAMPMPPMPAVGDDALQQIVAWLTSGEESERSD